VAFTPLHVALFVAEALEACGVRYVVGGSLASSLSGEPRSTVDIDLVVELTEDKVEALTAALGGGFHVEADTLRRAVRERSSANVIHRSTSTKVDLFVAGGTPLDGPQLDRRRRVQLPADPGGALYFCTPEDILLQKLRWYKLGNEISDRQWRDILGILLVQGDRLDQAYMRSGARTLGVCDLLQRALEEVRERRPRDSRPPDS
jgi:hypothetical protein